MKHLFKTLLPMFVLLMGLFMVRCKDTSDVAPNGGAIGVEDVNTGGTGIATNVNGYSFSAITSTGGTTYSFTLTRLSGAKDISHLIIGVDKYCPEGEPENGFKVPAFSIVGHETGAIVAQYEEGNGTGCDVTAFNNYFKFEFTDALAKSIKLNTPIVISFTTSEIINVDSWFVAVKAGNKCAISSVDGNNCNIPPPPAGQCSLSQGYFFAKPGDTWTDANGDKHTVTFGTHTYSKEEGKAIWETSNKGGKLDVKAAFLQATTIKLNFAIKGESIPSELQSAIDAIDYYFTYVFTEKLTPLNIPANSTDTRALRTHINTLTFFITNNHCE